MTVIGTNLARAVASNATRGHIWDQFSSETYKTLPPVGTIKGLYNPRDAGRPIAFDVPGGGRGYYRTASLTSLWATAPDVQKNSVGVSIKDHSIHASNADFRRAR